VLLTYDMGLYKPHFPTHPKSTLLLNSIPVSFLQNMHGAPVSFIISWATILDASDKINEFYNRAA